MRRRLYLTFPTPRQARTVVAADMHAVARPGVDTSGLPQATRSQREDPVWLLDRLFRYASLTLFGIAAVGLGAALLAGSAAGAAAAVVVMLATYVAGERLAGRVPHAHLADVHVPLEHGKVRLPADVPRERVRDIEYLVSHRHPEIGGGGVGWFIEALGV
jgi:hypothetical protein